MQPDEVWGERWSSATLPIAKRYMTVATEKQSLVCLAADRRTMAGLFELINEVGPFIAALKTHVDLIEDWSASEWADFCALAHHHNLLIFEDRKFADIGKISRAQMAGVYNIGAWSDIVTAHLISGPDVVDGLQTAWREVNREGGVLLLAQMSSRGNLLNGDYTNTVVKLGAVHEGVLGFIGNGSKPGELAKLRQKVGQQKMIWTPGVNHEVGDGEMGQRYGDPYDAVIAGSDCIIVGSGIHGAEHPKTAAQSYAQVSWNALLNR